jgi:hypothetical protein
VVLSSDSVRSEQIDDLSRAETGITHTSQDLVDRVRWLGNREIWSRTRDVGATSHELQARSANAVGNTDSTRELDEVTERNLVLESEWTLLKFGVQQAAGCTLDSSTYSLDDLVNTVVRV